MPEETIGEKFKEGLSNLAEIASKAPFIPLFVADIVVDNAVCGALEILSTIIKQEGEAARAVAAKVSENIDRFVTDVRRLIELED